MHVRFFLLSVLLLFAASAEASGNLLPYTPADSYFGLWLVLGVLAFILAARRLRFDTDERP